ncbi:acyltransferase, partial [Synechococcus sp. AH-551-E19]
VFLDQIKAVMIALVIATHTILVGTLFSTDLKQIIESAPNYEAISFWFGWICNTFYMNILFLISGYLVPSSVHKRGVANYARQRLLRLAIPLIIATFLLNNIAPLAGLLIPNSNVFGQSFQDLPLNRIGPQWFILVLIILNAIYCFWAFIRKKQFTIDNSKSVPGWRSWLISAAILGTLEVIMGYFSGYWAGLKDSSLDGLGYQGMHLWTYVFLFFVGCKAASHQWLERINKQFAFSWLSLSLLITLALLASNYVAFIPRHNKTSWEFISPLMAFLTPLIGWGFIAAVLTWSQAHEQLDSHWLIKAGKDSFGAYLIHIPLLAGAMVTFYSLGIKNIWILGLGSTMMAVFLSFIASHQLRKIQAIRQII